MAQPKLSIDPVLHRGQPSLFQAPDLVLRERLVGKVGQGWAPPQREPRRQFPCGARGVTGTSGPAGVCHQALELLDVKFARRDVQDVTPRLP